MTEMIIALIALAAMEIVLGIDNIVFITILSSKLPKDQQARARSLGLAAAMITRVLLLFSIKWVLGLKGTAFSIEGLPIPQAWLGEHPDEIHNISWRDLILLGGGLFLIWKSVHEIHLKLEGHEEHHQAKEASFASVIFQIAILDIVFSLDSVITAVGMVDPEKPGAIWVMVAAIVIAIGVMLAFAGPVSEFVTRHPTVKMLALSFLILIGVLLVAEGSGAHFNKGYVYFAMAFSLIVEMLNLRIRPHAPLPSQTVPARPESAD
jgi:predicted tellurium resistance membrane protein TerC